MSIVDEQFPSPILLLYCYEPGMWVLRPSCVGLLETSLAYDNILVAEPLPDKALGRLWPFMGWVYWRPHHSDTWQYVEWVPEPSLYILSTITDLCTHHVLSFDYWSVSIFELDTFYRALTHVMSLTPYNSQAANSTVHMTVQRVTINHIWLNNYPCIHESICP